MSVTTGLVHNFVCPHCGVLSQFVSRTFHYSYLEKKYYEISECQNQQCKLCTFFVYETQGWGTTSITHKKIFHYPTSQVTLHQSIPQDISSSYLEGLNCINIQANKAAVLMFRRTLQEICKNKGADPQKRLNDQIDQIIPKDLAEMAHEIRQWGNIGGHPDDIIKDVKDDDAKEMKELIDRIFDYLYILPWKVNESKKKRGQNP